MVPYNSDESDWESEEFYHHAPSRHQSEDDIKIEVVLEQPIQLTTVQYLLDQRSLYLLGSYQYLEIKNERLVSLIDELNQENNEIMNRGDF